ncbi:MAG: hypothetical protein ABIR96_01540, partial [Bdellovibrionota bacterium]
KPRVFTVQIPEFAYKLATNSCSASEFFAGIDAAGAPVCSHFFNNCPSGRFFAGFLPPAGGATAYSSDPQLNCVATKPASPPSSACPMGTVGITQSGGPTGIYIKCILASSTTVACPATTQVASGMSWDLNNRFAPILTCISRKGL